MTCPNCQQKLDCHVAPADPVLQPKAGDITICFYCHSINCFSADGELHEATDGEILQAGAEEMLEAVAIMEQAREIIAINDRIAQRIREVGPQKAMKEWEHYT